MKTFNIPIIYRSPLISAIKKKRKEADRLKKDFSPLLLDFGPVRFYLARHFGFCYGVENAIEIAFRTVDENPRRRIYLLSEMIHNPFVNSDLRERGVNFLMDTQGKQLIPFSELNQDDIVIIPAFGTTLEIESLLKSRGIQIEKYDTTCPFVEKVWNRSGQIAERGYSVIVHGKPSHEETRATFSHSAATTPTVVVKNMDEAIALAVYIRKEKNAEDFYREFKGRYSEGFMVERDLQKIGVVNQTTMLANETQAIADFLKSIMIQHYGLTENNVDSRFADTRDTLCYATNDNQTSVRSMLETPADLAIIVGGRNSSNTSHLVELCEEILPSYFVRSEEDLISSEDILHYNWRDQSEKISRGYLDFEKPVNILVTSGASCPDAIVENVIRKLLNFFPETMEIEKMIDKFVD